MSKKYRVCGPIKATVRELEVRRAKTMETLRSLHDKAAKSVQEQGGQSDVLLKMTQRWTSFIDERMYETVVGMNLFLGIKDARKIHCAVCLFTHSHDDHSVSVFGCGHAFCSSCIKGLASCPLCGLDAKSPWGVLWISERGLCFKEKYITNVFTQLLSQTELIKN